jgi:hypothetical protein
MPQLSCHKFALALELVALVRIPFVTFEIPNLYKSFSNLQVATNWLDLERKHLLPLVVSLPPNSANCFTENKFFLKIGT